MSGLVLVAHPAAALRQRLRERLGPARVTVTLHRSAALRGMNPLTGLPGSTVVGEEIGRRLKIGEAFACLYADLDQFKAYNDRYGFTRGDDVIRALARCVVVALEANN